MRHPWESCGHRGGEAALGGIAGLGDQTITHRRLKSVDVHAGEMGADLGIANQVADRAFAGGIDRRLATQSFQHRTHGLGRGRRRSREAGLVGEYGVQCGDQRTVVALGFHAIRGDAVDHQPDDIDGVQDGGDRVPCDDQGIVPEASKDILGGMGDRLKPGESQKAAGPLDCMNQPEDVSQQSRVIRAVFKCDKFAVEGLDALARLSHEILNDVVHDPAPTAHEIYLGFSALYRIIGNG